MLVERHKLTSGSTFHAAGLVGQLRSSANITQLLGYSVDLYKRLEAETGQATGWKMNGGLRLACNEERWNEVKRQATTAKSFGLEMHLLSADRSAGAVAADDGRRCRRRGVPADRRAGQPDRHHHGVGARRTAWPARRSAKTPTYWRSRSSTGSIKAVVTSQGRIECSVVVCCAGQWTRDVGGDGRRQRAAGVGAAPVRHHHAVRPAGAARSADAARPRSADLLQGGSRRIGDGRLRAEPDSVGRRWHPSRLQLQAARCRLRPLRSRRWSSRWVACRRCRPPASTS